jgi:hypothetical protein
MPRATMQDELKQRATRAIIGHAFFRIESALTIAMTLILIFLYPVPGGAGGIG